MFKVYTNIANRKEIDRTNSEQDVIDTIGEYIGIDENLKFIVRKEENGKETDYKTINNEIEYADYISDYNKRLKAMSCVELKSKIVESAKIKRLIK